MDSSIVLVIVLVILIVVGVNGFLYLMLRGKKTIKLSSFQMLQKATHRTRNPWEDENKALKELADLVEKIKDQDTEK